MRYLFAIFATTCTVAYLYYKAVLWLLNNWDQSAYSIGGLILFSFFIGSHIYWLLRLNRKQKQLKGALSNANKQLVFANQIVQQTIQQQQQLIDQKYFPEPYWRGEQLLECQRTEDTLILALLDAYQSINRGGWSLERTRLVESLERFIHAYIQFSNNNCDRVNHRDVFYSSHSFCIEDYLCFHLREQPLHFFAYWPSFKEALNGIELYCPEILSIPVFDSLEQITKIVFENTPLTEIRQSIREAPHLQRYYSDKKFMYAYHSN